jgi:hypothetical protein
VSFWLLTNVLAALASVAVGFSFVIRFLGRQTGRTRRRATIPGFLAASGSTLVPLWVWLGFASGAVFLLTRTAYPSYFVPVAPFAALLGGPLAARIVRLPRRGVAAAALAVVLLAAFALRPMATVTGFIPAPLLSATDPVADVLTRHVPKGASVIANRVEYAVLASRSPFPYFWDDQQFISARTLESRLPKQGAVVMYPLWDPASYPHGFTRYLDAHFKRLTIGDSYVWLMSRRRFAEG